MSDLILKDVTLAPYTTLGIGGNAEYFATVETIDDLQKVVAWAQGRSLPITIIGGGSNVLVADKGVAGLTVRTMISGITYHEHESFVQVKAGSGVLLDELIDGTVTESLWGLENLSGIPGTVGGAPIQNVGAYGVEVRNVIESVEVYNTRTGMIEVLSNEMCDFAYRDSLFKHEAGKQYIVTSVTFRVSKKSNPQITYKDLSRQFRAVPAPSIREIRDAVCEIRKNKFPNWHVTGTAGSFFKNPRVDATVATLLRARYSELPLYEERDGRFKVALGWILDRVLSLKGFREGNVGLYEHQALVLVNHGGATADEVSAFSSHIMQKIFDETNICVEREVVVLK